MRLLQQLFILVLAISSLAVHAAQPFAPTDAEMNNLPPFCKAKLKLGQGSPEYQMWQNTLGKDFMHTHHYCVGLNFMNRFYRSRSAKDKGFNLTNAENNLTYMVTHSSPYFSLMPDIYLNRGLVYSLMNQHGKAFADITKAIELNPQQAKAFNVLADHYVSTKQLNKALETVTEGLRHNPGTKSLQRRYTELGGKLPYPEPSQPVQVVAPQAETPAEATSNATAESRTESGKAELPTAPESVEQPRIGTPKNPYCRFCPD